VVRDLANQPLPHIDDTFAVARNLPAENLTATQRAALERSDALLGELLGADVIIIAAGMINFGIPSSLKAWIDHVLRPGIAFRYTPKGPEGLITGKRCYLVVARGGNYLEEHMKPFNFQDTYLRVALRLVGIIDIDVISIEGLAFGPDAAERATQAAIAKVNELAR
jgi:FMN-dependent NADH-azoreductase